MQNSVYGSSLNALHSTKGPVLRGGSRTRAMHSTTTALKRMTNAIVRTVHANPILSRSCCAITGKTIPPVAAPDAAPAIASTRFLEKYVATSEIVGQNTNPSPTPLQTPCARKSCQYRVVAMAVINTASTCSNEPVARTARKYPASRARPEKVPMR